jgi:hypothetical protein
MHYLNTMGCRNPGHEIIPSFLNEGLLNPNVDINK